MARELSRTLLAAGRDDGPDIGDYRPGRDDTARPSSSGLYAVGPFTLDTNALVLLRETKPLPVGERAVAIMSMLVEHSGRLVTKNDLITRVWRGLAVEDGNLIVQISALRRALATAPGGAAWIETLPRRGYRFVGPVTAASAPDAVAAPRDVPPATSPTVAVMPFRTIDEHPVPPYFAAGVAEEIVCMLAGLREVTVLSCGSTFAARDPAVDPRRIGRELNAQYLVTGAVRRRPERMRIIAELLETATGAVLWSRAFDAEESLLYDAQDSIVAQVAHSLAPRINQAELLRIRAKRPEDMAAHQLVLRAREDIYSLEHQRFEQAQALLRRAMALDSGYAAAYVLAAEWHSLHVGQGWSADPTADARAVEYFAAQALLRDGANARALAFLGHNKAYLDRDYDAALTLFDQALEAGPNNAAAWGWSSPTHSYLNDGAAAIRRAEYALRLSPYDPFAFQYRLCLCIGHYISGTFEQAVHWGLMAIRAHPAYTANLRYTAAALVALGRTEEATQIGARLLELEPDFRVRELVTRHPFRDRTVRELFGERLVNAGLPE